MILKIFAKVLGTNWNSKMVLLLHTVNIIQIQLWNPPVP